MAGILLQAGGGADAVDSAGNTPLHLAAWEGRLDVMEVRTHALEPRTLQDALLLVCAACLLVVFNRRNRGGKGTEQG